MSLRLEAVDRRQAAGADGPAVQLAARIIHRLASIQGAPRLVDVEAAHVDGCLYHGQVSLDFVERLLSLGGRVRVPTTLNVGSVDLLHPGRARLPDAEAAAATRLMRRYTELGCTPTWTCAPYQIGYRPAPGTHVAWAESNAVVFANSVLGARTNRYGDFVDACAALTGRVPLSELHTDAGRLASTVFHVRGLSVRLALDPVLFPVLGHLVGHGTHGTVAAVDGVAGASEDDLKAMGAAAASSGQLGLVHVVGITPEAPDLATVTAPDARHVAVGAEDLRVAADQLTTAAGGRITAVALGTPHASAAELAALAALLGGRRVHPGIEMWVNTSRAVVEAVDAAVVAALETAGVELVTDTCTYLTPLLRSAGPVMTSSAKWAWYAPANLGVDVVFGSLAECVESAVAGEVRRDRGLWTERSPAPVTRQDRRPGLSPHSASPPEAMEEDVASGEPGPGDLSAPPAWGCWRTGGPGTLAVRSIVPGTASGRLVVLDEPLSFWGGIGADGTIVDVHHPQHGVSLSGAVVALPAVRGSSSSASVLAEAIRAGTGPIALLMGEADAIVVLGAIVAEQLYEMTCPIAEIGTAALPRDGVVVELRLANQGGTVSWSG
ncbi:MAG: aconitase X [Acidimicrobiales bacterium]